MTGIAVIQARTSSSRLPAKVLLPLANCPVAVLAARRAANQGRRVIVATSDDSSDDCLHRMLVDAGIEWYRGSLDNVLNRLVHACSDLDDETVVIRLTADNVLPDGRFLDEVEDYFLSHDLNYLTTTGVGTGLPYGMSVEVTRVRHLRMALAEATSKYDLEHVTPHIIRKFGTTLFEHYNYLAMGHYRATIDCLDDYLCMESIFALSQDPVTEPWDQLVKKLKGRVGQPQVPYAASRLVLGTAQLGMSYGITNTDKLDDDDKTAMIRAAVVNGVQYLDTARAYGRSEEVIGKALADGWSGRVQVVTKLAPLAALSPDLPGQAIRSAVESSIFQSCTALARPRLDVVLLHRASDLNAWNGVAWQCLKELRDEGRITVLGVSVQTPDELNEVLDVDGVSHIQLPCNLLDGRWEAMVAAIERARHDRALVVHVRSTLLQGLLTTQDPQLWSRAHVTSPADVTEWIGHLVQKCGRSGIVDLGIAYLNSLGWVDGIVIGADNARQLTENLSLVSNPPLTGDEVDILTNTRPRLSEATLNPALWKLAA